MAFRFPRWTNTAVLLTLAVGIPGACAAVVAPMVYVRTPYSTGQYLPIEQPIEFDHRHHVMDDGIDCQYCHQTALTGARAGMPSTDVCMGCHSQVWVNSPMTEPIRRSYFTGTPIAWNRVNFLPHFVYFHHAVHTRRGVACATCHGQVEEMARVYKHAPLTMSWCLDCHRNPPANVGVAGPTNCTACHR